MGLLFLNTLCKQQELSRVNDANIEAYSNKKLYVAFEIISVKPSETVTITLLKLIGIMDIFLAITLIFYHLKWKRLLLWMSLWGFLTAFSRLIAFGLIGLYDILLRLANGAIPLIPYFIIQQYFKSQP